MKPFNEHVEPVRANFKKENDEGLHGDVIVTKKNKLPDGFESWPKVKDDCLAYGEATGHAHKLFGGEFDLRECPKTKTRHLRVVRDVVLKHQEHNPVIIPPGIYTIGIQQEYSPFERIARSVQD